jgi:hypothetical protein
MDERANAGGRIDPATRPDQHPINRSRHHTATPKMERVQVAPAATAAAEETMAMYDACWFHRCVLLPSPPPPPAPAQAASTSPTAGLRHRWTRSDEFRQGLEPLRVPSNRARLETILSGKDGTVAAPQPRRPAGRRQRRRRGRSMSELEFEELKGLQDLGFTFSDADVDSGLASIVPGLRRKRPSEETRQPLLATASAPASAPPFSSAAQGEEDAVASDDAAAPRRRPYLSEAWDEDEVRAMLRNWRIPPPGDGADLKQHILEWAHTVASAVQ